ncbi:MAG TPA: DUF885 domain-containing protein, partial [Balneolaceae bacterium]|nr:DUF885 domain-containing protein [Balneolaceae bacterium]
MKTLLSFLIFLFLTASASAQSVADLITTYQADYGALDRKYSIQPSDEYFDRFDQFYSEWLRELETLDFRELPHSQKVDYLLFKNDLERSAYFLDSERDQFEKIAQFIPAKDAAMDFINQRRVGTSMD